MNRLSPLESPQKHRLLRLVASFCSLYDSHNIEGFLRSYCERSTRGDLAVDTVVEGTVVSLFGFNGGLLWNTVNLRVDQTPPLLWFFPPVRSAGRETLLQRFFLGIEAVLDERAEG